MSKTNSRGSDRQQSRCGRRFSDEFKRDAVRLVVDEDYSIGAAAAAVGVSEKTMRGWHAKFAPAPAACGEEATIDELQSENKRLRKELHRAELEREILKKATAYFAKESQ